MNMKKFWPGSARGVDAPLQPVNSVYFAIVGLVSRKYGTKVMWYDQMSFSTFHRDIKVVAQLRNLQYLVLVFNLQCDAKVEFAIIDCNQPYRIVHKFHWSLGTDLPKFNFGNTGKNNSTFLFSPF